MGLSRKSSKLLINAELLSLLGNLIDWQVAGDAIVYSPLTSFDSEGGATWLSACCAGKSAIYELVPKNVFALFGSFARAHTEAKKALSC